MNSFSASAYGKQPHRGTLVLVLGILGIVACGVLAPFAWIMGKNDLQQMDAGQMDDSGRGITQAGMICGIVGSVILILGLLWIVFICGLAGLGASGWMAGA